MRTKAGQEAQRREQREEPAAFSFLLLKESVLVNVEVTYNQETAAEK